MAFYCAHTPIYMTVLRHKLAVAFQEHTSATYSVVMYNVRGKSECKEIRNIAGALILSAVLYISMSDIGFIKGVEDRDG